MRLITSTVYFLVSLGCAPSVPVIKVTLPVESGNTIRVLDNRPAEQKWSETTRPGSGFYVNRLGDEKFSPAPMTFLRSLFQARLEDRFNGKTISITSFKVSVSNAPQGTAPGVEVIGDPLTAVLGTIVGNVVVGSLHGTTKDLLVFCEIAGMVDGQVFKANEMLRGSIGTVEDSVKEVLLKTIDIAAQNINSL